MTTRKKATASTKGSKLKLKKETVRDLDAKNKAGRVKGGGVPTFPLVSCKCGSAPFKTCSNCYVPGGAL